MYYIVYEKQAAKDVKKIKMAHLEDKAKKLVEVVRIDPYMNPPAYEKLTGNLSGYYSRRINIQNRFVYQVDETPWTKDGVEYQGTVKIIRMWTHYEGI